MDAFAGRRAALGTSHEKEQVIAPILERTVGLSVFVPDRFDSDRFGTFTREKRRRGSQLDAARAKARAAMALTGADIGIASEGSFGQDPAFPLLPSHLELVVLIDRTLGIEVHGEYRGGVCTPRIAQVRSSEEALAHARAWDFPTHGVIVRPSLHLPWLLQKELRTDQALASAVTRLLRIPFVSSVWLEADLRAHRNPTRMEAIAGAAQDLAERLATSCPRCAKPGFGRARIIGGAPCTACGKATDVASGAEYACPACGYTETRMDSTACADPTACAYCNP